MVNYADSQLDLLFGALSDSTRRRMIEMLKTREMMVTELASEFDISLPAVSKHIKVLEKAGLVDRKRNGKVHIMSFNKDEMKTVWEWINRYRIFWESNLSSLESFLEKNNGDKGGK